MERPRDSDPLGPAQGRRRRILPWLAFIGLLLVASTVLLASFDWNVLRETAERVASRWAGRPITIGHLAVRPGAVATIVLDRLTVADASAVHVPPLAQLDQVELEVRLLPLLAGRLVIPHLRLRGGSVHLQRTGEGLNWIARTAPGTVDTRGLAQRVTLEALTLDDVDFEYRDTIFEILLLLRASRREEGPYRTRLDLSGHWRKTAIKGTADLGSTISLLGSQQPFPMRAALTVGKTAVRAEGQIADIAHLQRLDATFGISGPSLATLYPALPLALPETPPYRISGRLRRDGEHFLYEDFQGTIGGTDIRGDARFEWQEPRPRFTATLTSRKLDLADLGPMVGLTPPSTLPPATAPAQPQVPTAGANAPERVLPQYDFDLRRLNAMDADIRMKAESLQIPAYVPLEQFSTRIRLDGGVLRLDPVNFGFAGGLLAATLRLDARKHPMAGTLALDLRRVRLSQLFPTVERMKQSGGRFGAVVRLTGYGNSVATLLATANGRVSAAIAGGQISELAVWLANLHGGEIMARLLGGDRPTRIRCGAFAMDVEEGIGNVGAFVFDTEEVQFEGEGSVNLRDESLRLVLRPEPKRPGLLSLRGPVLIEGSFREAGFRVAPESIARGVGAVALGLLNPLLALLPLIETGPGENADCRDVLAPVRGALRQSGRSMKDAPPARDDRAARDQGH